MIRMSTMIPSRRHQNDDKHQPRMMINNNNFCITNMDSIYQQQQQQLITTIQKRSKRRKRRKILSSIISHHLNNHNLSYRTEICWHQQQLDNLTQTTTNNNNELKFPITTNSTNAATTTTTTSKYHQRSDRCNNRALLLLFNNNMINNLFYFLLILFTIIDCCTIFSNGSSDHSIEIKPNSTNLHDRSNQLVLTGEKYQETNHNETNHNGNHKAWLSLIKNANRLKLRSTTRIPHNNIGSATTIAYDDSDGLTTTTTSNNNKITNLMSSRATLSSYDNVATTTIAPSTINQRQIQDQQQQQHEQQKRKNYRKIGNYHEILAKLNAAKHQMIISTSNTTTTTTTPAPSSDNLFTGMVDKLSEQDHNNNNNNNVSQFIMPNNRTNDDGAANKSNRLPDQTMIATSDNQIVAVNSNFTFAGLHDEPRYRDLSHTSTNRSSDISNITSNSISQAGLSHDKVSQQMNLVSYPISLESDKSDTQLEGYPTRIYSDPVEISSVVGLMQANKSLNGDTTTRLGTVSYDGVPISITMEPNENNNNNFNHLYPIQSAYKPSESLTVISSTSSIWLNNRNSRSFNSNEDDPHSRSGNGEEEMGFASSIPSTTVHYHQVGSDINQQQQQQQPPKRHDNTLRHYGEVFGIRKTPINNNGSENEHHISSSIMKLPKISQNKELHQQQVIQQVAPSQKPLSDDRRQSNITSISASNNNLSVNQNNQQANVLEAPPLRPQREIDDDAQYPLLPDQSRYSYYHHNEKDTDQDTISSSTSSNNDQLNQNLDPYTSTPGQSVGLDTPTVDDIDDQLDQSTIPGSFKKKPNQAPPRAIVDAGIIKQKSLKKTIRNDKPLNVKESAANQQQYEADFVWGKRAQQPVSSYQQATKIRTTTQNNLSQNNNNNYDDNPADIPSASTTFQNSDDYNNSNSNSSTPLGDNQNDWKETVNNSTTSTTSQLAAPQSEQSNQSTTTSSNNNNNGDMSGNNGDEDYGNNDNDNNNNDQSSYEILASDISSSSPYNNNMTTTIRSISYQNDAGKYHQLPDHKAQSYYYNNNQSEQHVGTGQKYNDDPSLSNSDHETIRDNSNSLEADFTRVKAAPSSYVDNSNNNNNNYSEDFKRNSNQSNSDIIDNGGIVEDYFSTSNFDSIKSPAIDRYSSPPYSGTSHQQLSTTNYNKTTNQSTSAFRPTQADPPNSMIQSINSFRSWSSNQSSDNNSNQNAYNVLNPEPNYYETTTVKPEIAIRTSGKDKSAYYHKTHTSDLVTSAPTTANNYPFTAQISDNSGPPTIRTFRFVDDIPVISGRPTTYNTISPDVREFSRPILNNASQPRQQQQQVLSATSQLNQRRHHPTSQTELLHQSGSQPYKSTTMAVIYNNNNNNNHYQQHDQFDQPNQYLQNISQQAKDQQQGKQHDPLYNSSNYQQKRPFQAAAIPSQIQEQTRFMNHQMQSDFQPSLGTLGSHQTHQHLVRNYQQGHQNTNHQNQQQQQQLADNKYNITGGLNTNNQVEPITVYNPQANYEDYLASQASMDHRNKGEQRDPQISRYPIHLTNAGKNPNLNLQDTGNSNQNYARPQTPFLEQQGRPNSGFSQGFSPQTNQMIQPAATINHQSPITGTSTNMQMFGEASSTSHYDGYPKQHSKYQLVSSASNIYPPNNIPKQSTPTHHEHTFNSDTSGGNQWSVSTLPYPPASPEAKDYFSQYNIVIPKPLAMASNNGNSNHPDRVAIGPNKPTSPPTVTSNHFHQLSQPPPISGISHWSNPPQSITTANYDSAAASYDHSQQVKVSPFVGPIEQSNLQQERPPTPYYPSTPASSNNNAAIQQQQGHHHGFQTIAPMTGYLKPSSHLHLQQHRRPPQYHQESASQEVLQQVQPPVVQPEYQGTSNQLVSSNSHDNGPPLSVAYPYHYHHETHTDSLHNSGRSYYRANQPIKSSNVQNFDSLSEQTTGQTNPVLSGETTTVTGPNQLFWEAAAVEANNQQQINGSIRKSRAPPSNGHHPPQHRVRPPESFVAPVSGRLYQRPPQYKPSSVMEMRRPASSELATYQTSAYSSMSPPPIHSHTNGHAFAGRPGIRAPTTTTQYGPNAQYNRMMAHYLGSASAMEPSFLPIAMGSTVDGHSYDFVPAAAIPMGEFAGMEHHAVAGSSVDLPPPSQQLQQQQAGRFVGQSAVTLAAEAYRQFHQHQQQQSTGINNNNNLLLTGNTQQLQTHPPSHIPGVITTSLTLATPSLVRDPFGWPMAYGSDATKTLMKNNHVAPPPNYLLAQNTHNHNQQKHQQSITEINLPGFDHSTGATSQQDHVTLLRHPQHHNQLLRIPISTRPPTTKRPRFWQLFRLGRAKRHSSDGNSLGGNSSSDDSQEDSSNDGISRLGNSAENEGPNNSTTTTTTTAANYSNRSKRSVLSNIWNSLGIASQSPAKLNQTQLPAYSGKQQQQQQQQRNQHQLTRKTTGNNRLYAANNNNLLFEDDLHPTTSYSTKHLLQELQEDPQLQNVASDLNLEESIGINSKEMAALEQELLASALHVNNLIPARVATTPIRTVSLAASNAKPTTTTTTKSTQQPPATSTSTVAAAATGTGVQQVPQPLLAPVSIEPPVNAPLIRQGNIPTSPSEALKNFSRAVLRTSGAPLSSLRTVFGVWNQPKLQPTIPAKIASDSDHALATTNNNQSVREQTGSWQPNESDQASPVPASPVIEGLNQVHDMNELAQSQRSGSVTIPVESLLIKVPTGSGRNGDHLAVLPLHLDLMTRPPHQSSSFRFNETVAVIPHDQLINNNKNNDNDNKGNGVASASGAAAVSYQPQRVYPRIGPQASVKLRQFDNMIPPATQPSMSPSLMAMMQSSMDIHPQSSNTNKHSNKLYFNHNDDDNNPHRSTEIYRPVRLLRPGQRRPPNRMRVPSFGLMAQEPTAAATSNVVMKDNDELVGVNSQRVHHQTSLPNIQSEVSSQLSVGINQQHKQNNQRHDGHIVSYHQGSDRGGKHNLGDNGVAHTLRQPHSHHHPTTIRNPNHHHPIHHHEQQQQQQQQMMASSSNILRQQASLYKSSLPHIDQHNHLSANNQHREISGPHHLHQRLIPASSQPYQSEQSSNHHSYTLLHSPTVPQDHKQHQYDQYTLTTTSDGQIIPAASTPLTSGGSSNYSGEDNRESQMIIKGDQLGAANSHLDQSATVAQSNMPVNDDTNNIDTNNPPFQGHYPIVPLSELYPQNQPQISPQPLSSKPTSRLNTMASKLRQTLYQTFRNSNLLPRPFIHLALSPPSTLTISSSSSNSPKPPNHQNHYQHHSYGSSNMAPMLPMNEQQINQQDHINNFYNTNHQQQATSLAYPSYLPASTTSGSLYYNNNNNNNNNHHIMSPTPSGSFFVPHPHVSMSSSSYVGAPPRYPINYNSNHMMSPHSSYNRPMVKPKQPHQNHIDETSELMEFDPITGQLRPHNPQHHHLTMMENHLSNETSPLSQGDHIETLQVHEPQLEAHQHLEHQQDNDHELHHQLDDGQSTSAESDNNNNNGTSNNMMLQSALIDETNNNSDNDNSINGQAQAMMGNEEAQSNSINITNEQQQQQQQQQMDNQNNQQIEHPMQHNDHMLNYADHEIISDNNNQSDSNFGDADLSSSSVSSHQNHQQSNQDYHMVQAAANSQHQQQQQQAYGANNNPTTSSNDNMEEPNVIYGRQPALLIMDPSNNMVHSSQQQNNNNNNIEYNFKPVASVGHGQMKRIPAINHDVHDQSLDNVNNFNNIQMLDSGGSSSDSSSFQPILGGSKLANRHANQQHHHHSNHEEFLVSAPINVESSQHGKSNQRLPLDKHQITIGDNGHDSATSYTLIDQPVIIQSQNGKDSLSSHHLSTTDNPASLNQFSVLASPNGYATTNNNNSESMSVTTPINHLTNMHKHKSDSFDLPSGSLINLFTINSGGVRIATSQQAKQPHKLDQANVKHHQQTNNNYSLNDNISTTNNNGAESLPNSSNNNNASNHQYGNTDLIQSKKVNVSINKQIRKRPLKYKLNTTNNSINTRQQQAPVTNNTTNIIMESSLSSNLSSSAGIQHSPKSTPSSPYSNHNTKDKLRGQHHNNPDNIKNHNLKSSGSSLSTISSQPTNFASTTSSGGKSRHQTTISQQQQQQMSRQAAKSRIRWQGMIRGDQKIHNNLNTTITNTTASVTTPASPATTTITGAIDDQLTASTQPKVGLLSASPVVTPLLSNRKAELVTETSKQNTNPWTASRITSTGSLVTASSSTTDDIVSSQSKQNHQQVVRSNDTSVIIESLSSPINHQESLYVGASDNLQTPSKYASQTININNINNNNNNLDNLSEHSSVIAQQKREYDPLNQLALADDQQIVLSQLHHHSNASNNSKITINDNQQQQQQPQILSTIIDKTPTTFAPITPLATTTTTTSTTSTTFAPTTKKESLRVFSSFSGGVHSSIQQPATLRSQQLMEAAAAAMRSRTRASRTASTSFRLSPTSGLASLMIDNKASKQQNVLITNNDKSINRNMSALKRSDSDTISHQSPTTSIAAPLTSSSANRIDLSPRDFQHHLSDKKQDTEQQVMASSESSLVPSIVSFIIPTTNRATTNKPDDRMKLPRATNTLQVSMGSEKQQLITIS